mgnify:CR=1 FL=1
MAARASRRVECTTGDRTDPRFAVGRHAHMPPEQGAFCSGPPVVAGARTRRGVGTPPYSAKRTFSLFTLPYFIPAPT